MIPYLDEARVRALLRLDDLIPVMERALVDFSARRVAQPARQMLAAPSPGGYFAAMPAAGTVGMGAKLVSIYPANATLGLPTHLALIVLFRPETGEPVAVMDGRLITEMRTAAVSAVATRALSRPDARILAILGSGVQASSHAQALRLVRDFSEVRVWSRTIANAERFAAATGAVVAGTAEAAVRGADVIVTATAAVTPVLAGAWLEPGAHVNAIGWAGPNGRELDDAAMRDKHGDRRHPRRCDERVRRRPDVGSLDPCGAWRDPGRRFHRAFGVHHRVRVRRHGGRGRRGGPVGLRAAVNGVTENQAPRSHRSRDGSIGTLLASVG